MFLQKENKSIDEIGMKEKIIYERRKSSLKKFSWLFYPRRKAGRFRWQNCRKTPEKFVL